MPIYEPRSTKYWSTEDEKRFVSRLGTHAPQIRRVSSATPEDLLGGYLKGCEQRVAWGPLNKEVIIAFAEQQLRQMRGDHA